MGTQENLNTRAIDQTATNLEWQRCTNLVHCHGWDFGPDDVTNVRLDLVARIAELIDGLLNWSVVTLFRVTVSVYNHLPPGTPHFIILECY